MSAYFFLTNYILQNYIVQNYIFHVASSVSISIGVWTFKKTMQNLYKMGKKMIINNKQIEKEYDNTFVLISKQDYENLINRVEKLENKK